MKNIISLNNKLIMQKIIERSHSLTGFSKYVTNIMLEKIQIWVDKKNLSYMWSVMSAIFINVLT